MSSQPYRTDWSSDVVREAREAILADPHYVRLMVESVDKKRTKKPPKAKHLRVVD